MECPMNIMSISPLPGTVWHHMTVIDPDTQKYDRAWSQVLLCCGPNLPHLLPRQIWKIFLVDLYTGLDKILG